MKRLSPLLLLTICTFSFAQQEPRPPNLFIITLDGFRWQEVFNGADAALINDTSLVKDTGIIKQLYWHDNPEERRKKLLPFFWNLIAIKGSLSGNRNFGNAVNVANPYKISYAGYNEILTGYADSRFIPNTPVANRNSTVLEFMNDQLAYRGKVAVFSSWNVMPFIINEKESGLPVNSGYEMLEENGDSVNNLINQVQQQVVHKTNTRYDMLTWVSAGSYIEKEHPRIVFISLGETDEFAHMGRYDQYLQKAHQADQLISDLWYRLQTDPFYKDNTSFIITTDHGRGGKTNTWNKHGFWIKGSGEAWTAMIGPLVPARGEDKEPGKVYQKQLAPTISYLLMGTESFAANHPVSPRIRLEENGPVMKSPEPVAPNK